MICISVTPTSRKLAKVDLLNASRQVDLIELCLDHLIKEPNIDDLIKDAKKPILISCRRPQEGGHFQGTEEQRLMLLRQAIVAGPAYVELDLDIAGKIPRFGQTKRVISYTSLDKPLGKIDGIFDQAKKANADVVKFTWPTPDLDAAWPLLAAVSQKRELPVVGIGLGQAGLTFSLLGRKYGSPWIYAALERGMEAHDGQVTIWDLDDIYGWKQIDAHTRFVGIAGSQANDTVAVRILNDAFKALDLNTRCLPLFIGKLDKMLEILKMNALVVGPSLSRPMLDLAQHVEEAADRSRSADLLLKQPDGWHAYNSLWRSTVKILEERLAKRATDDAAPSGVGLDPHDRPLDRRNVLVVGAGGLAQVLVHGIQKRKGILSITASRDDDAREVAQRFNIRFVPFASLYATLADVVVIADPALVMGHKKTELNPSYLRPNMTVADVSRLPDESPFLAEARQRGCKIVEPMDIYAEHLAQQFRAITGKDFPAAALEKSLSEGE